MCDEPGALLAPRLRLGPITNQTIADLKALNQPVAHPVVALGTNDAALIANGTRTFQQVADTELGQNRVHVADFHQVWLDARSPELVPGQHGTGSRPDR